MHLESETLRQKNTEIMQAIDAVKQNPDLLSQVTPATKFGNVKQIS